MTPGTELMLIGWRIVPNEEHVQCDHRFASQPLANEPLHSSQLFDTRPENVVQLRAHIVKLCRALSEELYGTTFRVPRCICLSFLIQTCVSLLGDS